MQKFRKIGILSSGGDAPGMNAAIRAVTRRALSQGIEVVGILGGYAGLLGAADESDPDVIREKHLRPLDAHSVSNIVTRGGTILYSARCDEFRTQEGQQKAANTCKLLGLDGLVAIGGDGTFRGAQDLSKFGISVVGIPGTIDNDIVCTDFSSFAKIFLIALSCGVELTCANLLSGMVIPTLVGIMMS